MSVSTGGNVIAPRSTASMIRTFASAGARDRARMSGSFPEAARTASTTSSSGSSSTKASFTMEPRLCSMRTTAVRARPPGKVTATRTSSASPSTWVTWTASDAAAAWGRPASQPGSGWARFAISRATRRRSRSSPDTPATAASSALVSGSGTARNDSTNSSRVGPSGSFWNGLCDRGSTAASNALASPSRPSGSSSSSAMAICSSRSGSCRRCGLRVFAARCFGRAERGRRERFDMRGTIAPHVPRP